MRLIEGSEFPDDEELLTTVLDVESQGPADPRFHFDVQTTGWPWAHPGRERRGIEPLGVDDVGRCRQDPLHPGDQRSRRRRIVHRL